MVAHLHGAGSRGPGNVRRNTTRVDGFPAGSRLSGNTLVVVFFIAAQGDALRRLQVDEVGGDGGCGRRGKGESGGSGRLGIAVDPGQEGQLAGQAVAKAAA